MEYDIILTLETMVRLVVELITEHMLTKWLSLDLLGV
jgi:hypothetical protein